MVVSMYDSLAKQNNPTVTKVADKITVYSSMREAIGMHKEPEQVPMVTSSYDALAKLNNSKPKS